ncbi:MAG: hypothetical protein HY514_01385 [Candidatus Aenigmarchaeota archaeon]|nr:hypothetical protein [Candidatus Aenigmarchaeota archaeon]
MRPKPEEEKMLEIAAIRRLKTRQLTEWERDFVRNAEAQIRRRQLTEKQKYWLKKLKEKYLQR